MNQRADLQGQIIINITYSGKDELATIDEVNIHSSRPTQTSKILTGKTPEAATAMIGMVYSLCSTAQKCASVRAIENATGYVASPVTEAMRDAMVHLETLREHLLRILIHWSEFTGMRPEHEAAASVIRIRQDIERTARVNCTLFKPGINYSPLAKQDVRSVSASLAELRKIIEDKVTSCSLEQWQDNKLEVELSQGNLTTARALHLLIRNRQWENHCPSKTPQLELCTSAIPELQALMQSWSFIATPTWSGGARENSVLSRALPGQTVKPTDTTLKTRLLNQIDEVVSLQRLLEKHFVETSQTPPCSPQPESAQTTDAVVLNSLQDSIQDSIQDSMPDTRPETITGVGLAPAARGLLVHDLTLKNGLISDYRILAPTEWNFHPHGVIVTSLTGLQGPLSDLKTQATLLTELIDPCVGFTLEFERATANA